MCAMSIRVYHRAQQNKGGGVAVMDARNGVKDAEKGARESATRAPKTATTT